MNVVGLWRYLRQRMGRSRGPAPAPPGHGSLPAGPMAGRRVLIVDLDGRQGTVLSQSLTRSGFAPAVVRRDGAEREMAGPAAPAAVIVSGPANPHLYRTLRRTFAGPMLALAPPADDEQAVAAFAAGVDQFQAGPISCDEVVARLLALLRRAQPTMAEQSDRPAGEGQARQEAQEQALRSPGQAADGPGRNRPRGKKPPRAGVV